MPNTTLNSHKLWMLKYFDKIQGDQENVSAFWKIWLVFYKKSLFDVNFGEKALNKI